MAKSNLMAASNQWATRPADERFWNLKDLHAFLTDERDLSRQKNLPTHQLRAVANGSELMLQGPAGNDARLSNWSFQQLCTMTQSPASFLRQLPTPLVSEILNQRLPAAGDDRQSSLLIRRNGDMLVRALTTPEYGRIWDLDVVKELLPALDRGWRTPPARPVGDDPRARPATIDDILPDQGNFGLSVKVGDKIGPAGVYHGDRDMFVFLVNPERVVNDGVGGLMRGVFVWNSEVGKGAFHVRYFYLENVCGNHICWGASGVKDIKVIHRHGSIKGFGQKMARQIMTYANASVTEEENMIKAARSYELGDSQTDVVNRLYGMKPLALSKLVIEEAYQTAVEWEHTAKAPPTSAWGFSHGLTRYSQKYQNADERNRLDRAAGKILQLAAGGRAY